MSQETRERCLPSTTQLPALLYIYNIYLLTKSCHRHHSPNAALTRLLAESGAKLDCMVLSQTLLHLALSKDLDILKTLLEFRRSINIDAPNAYGFTALHLAATRSDTKHLQLLIKAGANLNVQTPNGQTPLHIAAEKAEAIGHLRFLLAQPDIELDSICQGRGSPLFIASRGLNVEGVRALLDAGANVNLTIPNSPFPTPLMSVLGTHGRTTRDKDVQTIDIITRMLVLKPRKKANVKQTNPGCGFYTALAAACFCAGPETLQFLVEQGAEVRLADEVSGRLPHHFAAANGLGNFRAIALSYRGDLMAPDKEEKNCLHWAAQFGNLRTVEFIIARLRYERRLECYINRPDSDGWTPLCWAARCCGDSWARDMRSEQPDFSGVVKMLLLNGAKPDVECKLGNGTGSETLTPLDLARRCDAGQDIISMLRQNIEARAEFKVRSKSITLEGPVEIYELQNDCTCRTCSTVSLSFS